MDNPIRPCARPIGEVDIAAQLAERYYTVGTAKQRKEGKELAEKVLRNMPRHPTAAYVKALTLLEENAVVGLTGFFAEDGRLSSLGIQCALCHSRVDDSVAPGIGRGFMNSA